MSWLLAIVFYIKEAKLPAAASSFYSPTFSRHTRKRREDVQQSAAELQRRSSILDSRERIHTTQKKLACRRKITGFDAGRSVSKSKNNSGVRLSEKTGRPYKKVLPDLLDIAPQYDDHPHSDDHSRSHGNSFWPRVEGEAGFDGGLCGQEAERVGFAPT
ncbi:hypothetical protein GWK47_023195 [Chionoecetes opilio]|uniref:Uncharacterized protein n=1 Tax=Chionoecetes opilio TaxID=41210 RepID=A0A8J4XMP2_CHIOP|nr:hypothetical protein GWK47_023195 [Chionoecetes opilio]